MYPWTRKFRFNLEVVRIRSPDPDPDRIRLGGGTRIPSALITNLFRSYLPTLKQGSFYAFWFVPLSTDSWNQSVHEHPYTVTRTACTKIQEGQNMVLADIFSPTVKLIPFPEWIWEGTSKAKYWKGEGVEKREINERGRLGEKGEEISGVGNLL